MLEPNQILQGRYHIIRALGHGGMGTVYEAKDKKLFGKLVALKEILLDKTLIPHEKDHRIVSRAFEREAQILTTLEHEAFPQVIDYFVENESQFLVMELIQGKDLSVLLRKRKTPFEVEEVIQWAIQLLDALDYLHTLNPPTIHRDIKPQNLKLTTRKRIKLLDFGIAKGAEFPSNITFSNQTFIAATFNYSPFEQVYRVLDSSFKDALKPLYGEQLAEIDAQTADARSDIYSLGATFYHLLTKQLPFDSLKRTLEHWVGNEDPLPSPQSLNPEVPTEISDWILRAMAVNRDDRFQTAAEMRDALQDIVEGNSLYEESTRNLKWQKEQELLLIERERLAEERRKFEQEREHFLHITQEPLSEALTIRDFPEVHQPIYKTKTSYQPDLLNQPSVTTVVGEKIPKERNKKVESPTDFTATSYLVNLKFGEQKEKKESAENEEKKPQAAYAASNAQSKPVRYLPISLLVTFLFGGLVLGGIILQGVSSKNQFSDNSDKSVLPNQNAVTVQPQTSPEAASETKSVPFETDANTALQTESTPKPFSEAKTKQINQIAKPIPPAPTPQRVKKATPKPMKTPKNPDCIFNNDCR